MLFYRDLFMLLAIVAMVLLITLVLLVPVCYIALYNRCKRKQRAYTKVDDMPIVEAKLFSPSIYAQIFILLCVGIIFVDLSALTDAPFYVIWLLFFLVWIISFTDYLRRRHCYQMISKKDVSLEENYTADEIEKIYGYSTNRVTKYYSECRNAVKANRIKFAIAAIITLLVTGFATVSFIDHVNCMCVAMSPVEISTYVTRSFSHKYCAPGETCNVYFTLADTERDLIMNFHTSESSDWAFVKYDLESHSRSNFSNAESWINSYECAVNVSTYKVETVRELQRWVHWADITNLTAGTTYYFIAVYLLEGNFISSKEYKVRTMPADGTLTFITGGDMSSDKAAEKLIKYAAAMQPNFALIGGDNAYDNGFKYCYTRWDRWFNRWDSLMTQNEGGYTIPVMLAIGNHEAGEFGAQLGDDSYYTSYFPQKLGLQTTHPRFRLPYHSHRFGPNTTFIILDSNVVTRMDGEQKEWLRSQLEIPSKVKIVSYHANLYPSAHLDKYIEMLGRKHWVPLFDEFNVTMVFENHLHLYKRTKPLRNDKVDPEGITYFGDGTWGVSANIVPLADDFYIEKSNKNQHFFNVSITNNTDIRLYAIGNSGSPFDSWEKHLQD